MVKETIEALISDKENFFNNITELEKELVEVNAKVKEETAKLWLDTEWGEVVDGRATDKMKKAYVDAQIRPYKDKQENLTNEINSIWRDVEIINDKIRFYEVYDD